MVIILSLHLKLYYSDIDNLILMSMFSILTLLKFFNPNNIVLHENYINKMLTYSIYYRYSISTSLGIEYQIVSHD